MARGKFDRLTDHPTDPRVWGAQCDRCPLNGSRPVFGDGDPNTRYAFIGEAPGREEVKVGVPFIARSGELFEAYIAKYSLNRTEVWIDNAICCFPPGGDLKSYLQVFKKQAKKAGVEFLHPVDACRPRLFTALRVPKCKKCGKWMRGPDALMCRCVSPLPVSVNPFGATTQKQKVGGRTALAKRAITYPVATGVMGNFAMLSILGFDGITAHHSYVEDMHARRERLKEFVQLNGGKKDGKADEKEKDAGESGRGEGSQATQGAAQGEVKAGPIPA